MSASFEALDETAGSAAQGASPAHRASIGRRVCLWGGLTLTVAWSVGFVLFLLAGAARPVTVSLPSLAPHPTGEHNLVAYEYGPVLRASSYHRTASTQHHPAFLVDGRAQPTSLEKWATDPADAAPWVELLWSGERQVQRVRIQHAGMVEAAELTSRQYRIACLAEHPPAPLVVTDNRAAIAEHAVACTGARGVRIDIGPGTGDSLVRVFEIEVWGQ